MNYPLHLQFKIFTLSSKITITDQTDQLQLFAKQKLLKLKESISIFADEEQTRHLYTIDADRIIDFSANYHFTDAQQQIIGAVRRKGMRSLFKAHYEIVKDDMIEMTITEENAWTKFFDSIFTQIPIIGLFAGYFFHPSYLVKTIDGREVMRLKKEPSFLERKYSIEKLDLTMKDKEEIKVLLSLFMLVLLERPRG